MTRRHRLAALLTTPLLVIGLASCADGTSEDPGTQNGTSAPTDAPSTPTQIPQEALPVEPAVALDWIGQGAVPIDVRTPEEFAEGHLDDALNIDWNAGHFAELVADLPREGLHVVYCRSGSRATAATAVMLELGFTNVVNGGAYDDLK